MSVHYCVTMSVHYLRDDERVAQANTNGNHSSSTLRGKLL